MATIIDNNNPNPNRTVLVDSGDSSAGWGVAVLVLVVVIAGGVYWYMHYRSSANQNAAPSTTIQVNVPSAGYTPTQTAPAQ